MVFVMAFIVWLFSIVSVHAACTWTGSVWQADSWADLTTCHTNASAGETIALVAGLHTASTVFTPTKAITIQGAGIGNTIVTGTAAGIIQWNTVATGGSPAGFTRLTGFTFKSGTGVSLRRLPLAGMTLISPAS